MQIVYIFLVMVGFSGCQMIYDKDGPWWMRLIFACVAFLALSGFEYEIEKRMKKRFKDAILDIKTSMAAGGRL